MNTKRMLMIGGLLLVAFVALTSIPREALTPLTAQDDAPAYQIEDRAQVEQGDLTQTVTAAGTLTHDRSVTLAFQSQTPVVEVLVTEGQRVAAGDVLARVAARDLDERVADAALRLDLEEVALASLIETARPEDVAVAQAAVEAAELALFGAGTALTGADSIAAEIDRLNAELQANQLWQQQLNRDNNPTNLDAAYIGVLRAPEGSDAYEQALEDYQLAEAQAIISENNFDSLESGVVVAWQVAAAEQARPTSYGGTASAQQQLVQAQIQLDNLIGDPDIVDLALAEIGVALARLDLAFVEDLADQAVLVAPFDGLVARVNLTPGEVPPPDAVVLTDDSSFELVVPVDEIDVTRLSAGQPVSIALDALPDAEVTGVIEHIAFTPTPRGDLTTYDVRIRLDQTAAPIRAGMTATADIVTVQASDTVLVPSRFVQENAQFGLSFVVVEDAAGELAVRRVTVGVRGPSQTEILDGIGAGETVVLLPQSELQRLLFGQMGAGREMGGFFDGR
jgi:multidrug efflux pump subunit AcrA (membrane-fusion protein)